MVWLPTQITGSLLPGLHSLCWHLGGGTQAGDGLLGLRPGPSSEGRPCAALPGEPRGSATPSALRARWLRSPWHPRGVPNLNQSWEAQSPVLVGPGPEGFW